MINNQFNSNFAQCCPLWYLSLPVGRAGTAWKASESKRKMSFLVFRRVENISKLPLILPLKHTTKEDKKGIGQPTDEKVNEELFLDNPLQISL
jgi:hypothetical protein